MTPGRVRAGFRLVRAAVGTPASAPKFTTPGPGRPKGSKNKHKAPRHPVGKTTVKNPAQPRTTERRQNRQVNVKYCSRLILSASSGIWPQFCRCPPQRCTRRTAPRPVRRGNATNRSPLEGMDET